MNGDGTLIVDLELLSEFVALASDRIARGGQQVGSREKELLGRLKDDLADHRTMLEFFHRRQVADSERLARIEAHLGID